MTGHAQTGLMVTLNALTLGWCTHNCSQCSHISVITSVTGVSLAEVMVGDLDPQCCWVRYDPMKGNARGETQSLGAAIHPTHHLQNYLQAFDVFLK